VAISENPKALMFASLTVFAFCIACPLSVG